MLNVTQPEDEIGVLLEIGALDIEERVAGKEQRRLCLQRTKSPGPWRNCWSLPASI